MTADRYEKSDYVLVNAVRAVLGLAPIPMTEPRVLTTFEVASRLEKAKRTRRRPTRLLFPRPL